ncbi:MAG: PilC/PilY family type IV pilus protein [Polyangiaceae bacterium]
MFDPRRTLSNIAIPALLLGWSTIASAQVDVNPPRPNVLLLVDSSGSMEYTTSALTFPNCNPTASTTGANKSRWINLVEALTGNISDYRCEAVKRNTTRFRTEYQVSNGGSSGPNPPDYLYPLPYHRPMSGTCAPTPGADADSIRYCTYDSARPCTVQNCTIPDAAGGLLDAFKQEIRFGLMTFDTLPSASTGMDGTWTYKWGTDVKGAPKDCVAVEPQDVGARNALAPLWEGRLIAFGPPQSSDELGMLKTRNETIQKALLATRPFGATPIAGMLKDARDFLWYDPDPDGSGTVPPSKDPYVLGKCRRSFIILLTDGEPNMDLRPFCENSVVNPVCGPAVGDCCPFQKPEDIARNLAAGSGGVATPVFVVGFAVSQTLNEGTPVECTNLTSDDLTSPTGLCAKTTSSQLKVCCTLSKIAYNGGTDRAYFADTAEELRSVIADILDKATQGTTSRTYPVFASATGTTTSGTASFRFFTSFQSKISGMGLWKGVVERQRYVCESGQSEAKPAPIDDSKGDDFVSNVNSSTSPPRRFITYVGNVSNNTIYSTRTIRTYADTASSDGLGNYTGRQIDGDRSRFPTDVPALALAPSLSGCMSEPSLPQTEDQCRNRYLKWLVGDSNGSAENYHRCPVAGAATCNLVGDIYHSTPALVNRPSENLRDESYQRFSLAEQRKRPLVLYTSTNDGFLHAFKVASNDPADTTSTAKIETRTNNELWAFIPPAVLPRIADEYPNVRQPLLDGAPIVRDVAGAKSTASSSLALERNLDEIASADAIWRTILVQSFGAQYPGYFALDVTDPVAGPRFLWQLTTDSSGQPLFGDSGATPTITTLFFDPDSGTRPREIAVALLPGGDGGAAPDTTKTCPRSDVNFGSVTYNPKPRTEVPCYTTDASGNRDAARRGRSLTIVRLDNGKIIRTFRRSNADAPASVANLVIASPLDSPITGQPSAYPGWTGAIADRAFVGDRDGSLWRLDLSSTDPNQWTMKLFFDAYRGRAAHSGQPIATAPIISTNESGEVVLAFSTGSQDDLVGTANTQTFLYSLVEKAKDVVTSDVLTDINWYYALNAGERVTGPLTLFSNGIYFSTYTPPAQSDACSSGSSRVGGMHYTLAQPSGYTVAGDDKSGGGVGRLPTGGNSAALNTVQFYTQNDGIISAGSVIFGASIAQVPSCFETTTTTGDPFFGSGATTTTMTSAATYQLVVHTGKQGTAAEGSKTNTVSVTLPTPDTSPRIDSWALVME